MRVKTILKLIARVALPITVLGLVIWVAFQFKKLDAADTATLYLPAYAQRYLDLLWLAAGLLLTKLFIEGYFICAKRNLLHTIYRWGRFQWQVKPPLLPSAPQNHIDALTGALNRIGFEKQAIDLLSSQPGSVALCVIDIDRFKYINHSYGRAAGDELLSVFYKRMKKAVRASDCFARWGGEEFVVLSMQPSEKAASRFAAKLCAVSANSPFKISGCPELQITVSIGLAQHDPKETFNSLFLRADAALFHAKQSGKNRVCIAPSEREA